MGTMAEQHQSNGPYVGMYSLKPYYNSSDPVELPNCMYKMDSIHKSANQSFLKDGGCEEQLPEQVLALERRQEDILSRLAALKSQVEEMVAASVPTSATRSETLGEVIEDLVISANPSCPPLSLLVLKELLGQQYKVLGKCHIHSSAGPVSDKLKNVLSNNNATNLLNRGDHQLAFTLIWKEVKNGPSLMVSPKLQTSIQGEANIARYLARLLKPAYDTADNIVAATEIDNFVDMAYPLLTGSSKEKAAVMKALNAKLGKSDWLVGSQLSLADIVLWSALQQSGQTEAASANIKKWLAGCNQQTAFQYSLHLVQM